MIFRKRSLALKRAKEYEANCDVKNALNYYSSAVDITPDLYIPLIKELIAHNISYIVAPYEADAELAYLSRMNLVDFVITIDSDLIAFGCSKILFDLNNQGAGFEFSRKDLFLSESLSFTQFTEEMALCFFILLGCDYLKNPKQWGWKRLFPIIEKGKTASQIIELVCEKAHMDELCVWLFLFILDISKISWKPTTRFIIKSFLILWRKHNDR